MKNVCWFTSKSLPTKTLVTPKIKSVNVPNCPWGRKTNIATKDEMPKWSDLKNVLAGNNYPKKDLIKAHIFSDSKNV